MNKIFAILLIALFNFQAQSQIISEGIKLIVPEPSGNENVDRRVILKALDKANIGDTIQFSSGVYLIGKKIQITTNGIILKGNSKGTVIRGCDPKKFTEPIYGLLNCGGFELIGQNQSIENFTFEYAWHGLMIGCCLPESMEEGESGSNI